MAVLSGVLCQALGACFQLLSPTPQHWEAGWKRNTSDSLVLLGCDLHLCQDTEAGYKWGGLTVLLSMSWGLEKLSFGIAWGSASLKEKKRKRNQGALGTCDHLRLIGLPHHPPTPPPYLWITPPSSNPTTLSLPQPVPSSSLHSGK